MCPTCNHTMACLSLQPRTHWCPRCGTIVQGEVGDDESKLDSQVPKKIPKMKAIIDKAQAVLSVHIVPDGKMSDHEALCELHGIFDCSE